MLDMAVKFDDLPAHLQAQVLNKTAGAGGSGRGAAQITQVRALNRQPRKPAQKYNNEPTSRLTSAGRVLRFDSKKEAVRYDQLMLMLHAGQIKDLRLQVDFTLIEAFTKPDGERVPAMRYKADFCYKQKVDPKTQAQNGIATVFDEPGWRYVVEDVKSAPTRTDKYKIKRKLLYDKYRIEISEV